MTDCAQRDLAVDRIYHGDSRDMREVPNDVISLIVCSPPYNVRKPYSNHDDDMPLAEYKRMLLDVWRECERVLRPGGRLCVNVAGVWRQPYLPLHAIIWRQLHGLRFKMRGEIIWDKGASVGVSTAWGSFASPSNPTLRDVHEYVLVFSKGNFRLDNVSGEAADITNEQFVEWTRSVWQIPTESSTRVGHPAPFPVELPMRLALLYSYPGDIVLDPFAGSGSTCVAARLTNRRYIGYDIDAEYVRIAKERVDRAAVQLSMPGLASPNPRTRGKGRRPTGILRLGATALLGPTDIRNREVRVGVGDGQVQLGIRTSGQPDIQKQHINASLSAADAELLADALGRAAASLNPEPVG